VVQEAVYMRAAENQNLLTKYREVAGENVA
jgi:hypothetical protein